MLGEFDRNGCLRREEVLAEALAGFRGLQDLVAGDEKPSLVVDKGGVVGGRHRKVKMCVGVKVIVTKWRRCGEW